MMGIAFGVNPAAPLSIAGPASGAAAGVGAGVATTTAAQTGFAAVLGKAGALLANPWVMAALIVLNIIMMFSASKAARRARRDARAVSGTLDAQDSGKLIPIACGRFSVEGLLAYAFTGKDFPGVPPNTDDVIGTLPANVVSKSTRKQYLLMQDVLVRHGINKLIRVFADESDIQRGELAGTGVAVLGQPGIASSMATLFSGNTSFTRQHERGPETGSGNRTLERDDNSTFDGLGYVSCVFRNKTTDKNAYHYRGVPRRRYLGEGKKLRTVAGGP